MLSNDDKLWIQRQLQNINQPLQDYVGVREPDGTYYRIPIRDEGSELSNSPDQKGSPR